MWSEAQRLVFVSEITDRDAKKLGDSTCQTGLTIFRCPRNPTAAWNLGLETWNKPTSPCQWICSVSLASDWVLAWIFAFRIPAASVLNVTPFPFSPEQWARALSAEAGSDFGSPASMAKNRPRLTSPLKKTKADGGH